MLPPDCMCGIMGNGVQAVQRGHVSSHESATVKSSTLAAFDTRLSALEDQSNRVISMIRTVESQVPAIADLRAFATKSELADKASIADVNEVPAAHCSWYSLMWSLMSLTSGTVIQSEQGQC